MKSWWKEGIIYQIYPISFKDSNGDGCGDLNGVIEKLDYLVELGVNIIWFSPYLQSPYVDNGYDISDYHAIDSRFGTMQDWEHLVCEMHKRGLKLIMDLVVNHCSDQHIWFKEALKSKDNPYRDYFIWRDGKTKTTPPNNWTSHFGNSAWEYSAATEQYYLHLFAKEQPDLNWSNPAVRKEIFAIMNFWAQKGVDGFRLDVMHAFAKPIDFPDGNADKYSPVGSEFYSNTPTNHEYIKELNKEVFSKYDLFTIGETGNVTVDDAILYTADESHEVNTVFQFQHVYTTPDIDVNGYYTGKSSTKELKDTLSKWQCGVNGRGWNSLFLSNHDQPRQISRFGNADTYHNKSAKMLATILHLQQGTPCIYQGEELGMTNLKVSSIEEVNDISSIGNYYEKLAANPGTDDILLSEINAFGRDNSRTPMQWDNSANAGFTSGTPWLRVNPNYLQLNAQEQLRDADSVFHYYQKLNRLRKANPVVVYGDFTPYYENSELLFVFTRTLNDRRLLVIANITDEPAPYHHLEELSFKNSELYIANYDCPKEPQDCLLRPFEVQAFLLY